MEKTHWKALTNERGHIQMANQDIRKEIKENGFYLWQIAYKIGVTETTLIRWLRIELKEDKKTLIRSAIKELKEGAI